MTQVRKGAGWDVEQPRAEQELPVGEVLVAAEVAAWLQYHVKTVQRMAKEGTIPAKRVGGEWRFLRSALLRWMEGG